MCVCFCVSVSACVLCVVRVCVWSSKITVNISKEAPIAK